MAFFQYLVFDGENLPLPDSYEVELEDVETSELKLSEMYVTGYKAKLKKDTSYKGLWTVSFTLKEM